MKRGRLIIVGYVVAAATVAVAQQPPATMSQQPPTATFRSAVDLVRVSAVVRDHKGRFVRDLTERDFEVLDRGQTRPIAEFRRDLSGVSVALLFDVSGSMEG